MDPTLPREPTVVSLTVPSQLASLARVRTFIESFCHEHMLNSEVIAAIVLAVHEAVANVIRHAHQYCADLPINIRCSRTLDAIEVVVEDEGECFDISAVPAIDPKQIREGGRGVYLMRTLMDKLTSCCREDGGNTLRMVKRC